MSYIAENLTIDDVCMQQEEDVDIVEKPRSKNLSLQKAMGKMIRKRRRELRLTLKDLEERSGLHFTYIHSVESGSRNVTIGVLELLAEALKVSMGELLPW